MFERFTEEARHVVVLAQEEAMLLNHNYIGTEHILLGLIHDGEGVAAEALSSLGVSLDAVRQQVEDIIGHGQSPPTGHIPFTPRAKKVLELSLREAIELGHEEIGPEHILLGLVREGEGVAAQVLYKLGADLDRVRRKVLDLAPAAPPKPRRGLGPLRGRVRGRGRAPVNPSPTCPGCGSSLGESAAYRVLKVPRLAQEEEREVTFVFCRNCGIALGILPGP